MKIESKNMFVFFGIAMLLIVSYFLAINKTFLLREESHRLEAQVRQYRDIPRKLSALGQKENYYDSILHKMDFSSVSIQNDLLRTINQEAHKHHIKVMDFNQPHIHQRGENELYTFSFNVSGGYTNILKAIHAIEQKGNFGEIAHLNFEKKRNLRTRTYSLGATVFVQQEK